MKIFKTRDSATSALRKLGINSRDYNLFLTKQEDGVHCNLTLAKNHLEGLKKTTKPLKVGKATHRPKTDHDKPERISCSSVAKDLILAGKTNQEVWDVISKQFKLDATKKHYPTWYRCQLKRKGELK